jgi:hypothetical protein
MATQLKPRRPIRRFDIFAEYRKLDAEDEGMARDEAKGYGLWVAKVVAARKFGRVSDKADSRDGKPPTSGKWHVLGDEPQTDALFDHEIIERMGPDFYSQVFAPAIREARSSGQTYESIRDRLRRRWKPESSPK